MTTNNKPKERKLLSKAGQKQEQKRKESVRKEMAKGNPKIDNNIIKGYN
jgi:hypothetical protein